MQVLVAKNYDAMSRAAADIVEHQIQAEPQALISFPGGDTPVGMLEVFCSKVNRGEIDPAELKFVQLDDWVGIGPDDAGSCSNFIREKLLKKMSKPFADAFLFDGSQSKRKASANGLLMPSSLMALNQTLTPSWRNRMPLSTVMAPFLWKCWGSA